MNVTLNVNKSL